MASIIETENLYKTYANFHAVENVSFTVTKNQVCGFLGPNGAGKSTTMKMLLGLTTPTRGNIKLFGQNLKQAVECYD